HCLLQPLHRRDIPRRKNCRYWQFSSVNKRTPQPAEITGASFEHAGQGHRPPPAPNAFGVLADQSDAQGRIFWFRPWFPFAARIQHFRYTAPDESRALICYPETTRTRTGFERVLHAERHLLHAEERTRYLHRRSKRISLRSPTSDIRPLTSDLFLFAIGR